MLEKGKNKVLPCGRNSVGALDSVLSSSFWSLCFLFSAAASSFAKDSIMNFQKKGFPESLFCRFLWSNQASQTITQTITKPKRWPIARWKNVFLGAPCSSKMSSKQAQDIVGTESGRYENEIFVPHFPQKLNVEDVKMKLSCETSLKDSSGRCENAALVGCGDCDSGGGDTGGW